MILALGGKFKQFSHLNLEKFSGDLAGFEPTTAAMQVQSYEASQLIAGQFVGLMFFHERNDE